MVVVAVTAAFLLSGCGDARRVSGVGPPSTSPSESPTPSPTKTKETKYVGFHPDSSMEDGMVIMPLVFVDGSSGEAVAPADLGIQKMSAAIYTAGGLGGIDRTMDFRYGEPAGFVHEGPLETYEGYRGQPVEVWKGTPGDWECPNLVFRFEDWYVGVRTCQGELSKREKEQWALSLRGDVTKEGFLVLSAERPLQLQKTGGHEGPQMYLGMEERSNWVQLSPGTCNHKTYATDGDVRTMSDGTQVTFNQLEDGNSKIQYDWFVSWCEDGLMRVQVEYASEDFARAAAAGLRLRDIVLAD